MYWRILTLGLCALAGACAGHGGAPRTGIVSGVNEAPAWRTAMAPRDSIRLDGLRAAWGGLYGKLPPGTRTVQGALVDPKAGLDHPTLTPGSYRCRQVRIHAAGSAVTARAAKPDFCFVSAGPEGFGFAKQTGTDPSAGYLYLDGDRYVFLGARQRRAGDNSTAYGKDSTRNLVGVAERIGGFRWRLAIAGADATQLDIYELTPVPPELQPKP